MGNSCCSKPTDSQIKHAESITLEYHQGQTRDNQVEPENLQGDTPQEEMPPTTRKKGRNTNDGSEEPAKKKTKFFKKSKSKASPKQNASEDEGTCNSPKTTAAIYGDITDQDAGNQQGSTYENPPDTQRSMMYVVDKGDGMTASTNQTNTESGQSEMLIDNGVSTSESSKIAEESEQTKLVADSGVDTQTADLPTAEPRNKKHELTKQKLKKERSENERLREAEKSLKKELSENAAETSKIKSDLASARKKNKDITDRSTEALSQRDAQISTLKSQLVTLSEEKDTLLTRLSSLAGARLLDNNPNIADLSDSNRPTKLAEQYSELYDNEWTDAYSALEEDELSENQCIKMLLNMLITIYRTCEEKADSQNKGVHAAVSEFIKDAPLPPELRKHLKESRKKNYKEYLPQLKQSVTVELSKLKLMNEHRLKMTDTFLDKSLTICWLMCIQDPPVYIDCNVHIRGQKFQKSSYKEYTKSGPIVDFVVWPIVYLQKDGAMLCKGTIQCTASKDDLASIEDKKPVKVGQFSKSLHVSTSKTAGVLPTTPKRQTVFGHPPQPADRSVGKYKQNIQVGRQSAPNKISITPTKEGTGKSKEINTKDDGRNGPNTKAKEMSDVYIAEQSDTDARAGQKGNSTNVLETESSNL